MPNIDGVLKTLGVETNPANADLATGGAVDVGIDVEGCQVAVDDNQLFEFGLSGVGVETCGGSFSSSCQSSASISSISSISLSYASVLVDMPSMTSEIVNSPRIPSISSTVSLPNSLSRIQATRYIITILPCSPSTAANRPKIAIASASTTKGEVLLIGALFCWTCRRKSVVSLKTGWEVIWSGISS